MNEQPDEKSGHGPHPMILMSRCHNPLEAWPVPHLGLDVPMGVEGEVADGQLTCPAEPLSSVDFGFDQQGREPWMW